eukprot:6801871-Prorocentrum_lima.AAC.1
MHTHTPTCPDTRPRPQGLALASALTLKYCVPIALAQAPTLASTLTLTSDPIHLLLQRLVSIVDTQLLE